MSLDSIIIIRSSDQGVKISLGVSALSVSLEKPIGVSGLEFMIASTFVSTVHRFSSSYTRHGVMSFKIFLLSGLTFPTHHQNDSQWAY